MKPLSLVSSRHRRKEIQKQVGSSGVVTGSNSIKWAKRRFNTCNNRKIQFYLGSLEYYGKQTHHFIVVMLMLYGKRKEKKILNNKDLYHQEYSLRGMKWERSARMTYKLSDTRYMLQLKSPLHWKLLYQLLQITILTPIMASTPSVLGQIFTFSFGYD